MLARGGGERTLHSPKNSFFSIEFVVMNFYRKLFSIVRFKYNSIELNFGHLCQHFFHFFHSGGHFGHYFEQLVKLRIFGGFLNRFVHKFVGLHVIVVDACFMNLCLQMRFAASVIHAFETKLANDSDVFSVIGLSVQVLAVLANAFHAI